MGKAKKWLALGLAAVTMFGSVCRTEDLKTVFAAEMDGSSVEEGSVAVDGDASGVNDAEFDTEEVPSDLDVEGDESESENADMKEWNSLEEGAEATNFVDDATEQDPFSANENDLSDGKSEEYNNSQSENIGDNGKEASDDEDSDMDEADILIKEDAFDKEENLLLEEGAIQEASEGNEISETSDSLDVDLESIKNLTEAGNFNLYTYRADLYSGNIELGYDNPCQKLVGYILDAEHSANPAVEIVKVGRDNDKKFSLSESVEAWKKAHYVTDLGKITEGKIDEIGYYEGIILGIFSSEFKADNVGLDIEKQSIGESNRIISKVKTFVSGWDDADKKVLDKGTKLSELTSDQKAKLKDCIKNDFETAHPKLSKSADFVDDLNTIVESFDTLYSALEQMANYVSVCEMGESKKAMLQKMCEKCPYGSMKTALKDIVKCFDSYSDGARSSMMASIRDVSVNTCGELLDCSYEALVNSNPYSKAFMVGAKIGTFLGDTVNESLFNTKDIAEQYIKMECLIEFENLAREAAKDLEQTYRNAPTTANAENYFESIDTLLSTAILGCEYAKKFADSVCKDSTVGAIEMWMSAAKRSSYEQFIQAADELKMRSENRREDLLQNFLAILEVEYPEIFKILIGEQDVVHIKEIYFKYDKITVDLSWQFYPFIERPIISPHNASNKNVQYTCSDEDVLTLKESGQIVPKKVGTAIVTAKSEDGGFIDSIEVEVYDSGSGKEDQGGEGGDSGSGQGKTASNWDNFWVLRDQSDYTVKIWKYRRKDNETDVVIPSTFISSSNEVYKVTSIAGGAFHGCSSIVSVKIPDSVTSIEEGAFYQCWNLVSLEIPNSVTSIGSGAFGYCTSLVDVEIPNSVTSIGSSAFSNCTSLKNIKLSNRTTSIEHSTFFACKSLVSIEITNSVKTIGDCAFQACDSLKNIEIPDNVVDIGKYTFADCINLVNARISNNVASIGQDVFLRCNKLERVESFGNPKNTEISLGVAGLGDRALSGCSSLLSVEIPSNVTCIGADAFSGCSSLTSVKMSSNVVSIGRSAFGGCSNLKSVETFGDTKNIEIPSDAIGLGNSAFTNCSSLVSIKIPNLVTSIGSSAFSGCSSLTSLEIPNNVTNIGVFAFYKCSNLESIVLPRGITNIDSATFSACSNLSSIKIPESVTSINSNAFEGCHNLSIYYEGSKEQWDSIVIDAKAIESTAKIYFDKADSAESEGTRIPLSEATIELSYPTCVFDGTEHRPNVTIKMMDSVLNPSDYDITYSSNINAGIALVSISGKGNYTGSVKKAFIIKPVELINTSISKIDDQTYENALVSPEPILTANGMTLVLNKDYTLSYQNNNAVGTATVIATGKGNYTGTTKTTFKIVSKETGSTGKSTTSKTIQQKITKAVSKAKTIVSGQSTTISVSGSNLKGEKVFSSGNKKVATVSASGKITAKASGTATISVYVKAKGNYAKSNTASFKITVKKPAKPTLSSVKGSKGSKGSITAKWKKTTCSGYVVEYATDKNFKKNRKTLTVKGGTKTNTTIKSLKKNQTYFVRVYAYGSSTSVKSAASTAKSVKCK
ncbi:MAG: leucine-rich repeat protein [Lachnospiraceae bacterium]|nr:leucine-rich repeat protein [Lachnospiraceae bacterium]